MTPPVQLHSQPWPGRVRGGRGGGSAAAWADTGPGLVPNAVGISLASPHQVGNVLLQLPILPSPAQLLLSSWRWMGSDQPRRGRGTALIHMWHPLQASSWPWYPGQLPTPTASSRFTLYCICDKTFKCFLILCLWSSKSWNCRPLR